MNKIQVFLLGGAALAFSMASSPITLYADASAASTATTAPRPGMHRMFGAGAPLISIALQHQSDLNLTGDQVANLEKIRTDYQTQTTPLYEQLRSIEAEIRNLLDESPANLIQAKVKIEQSEKLRSELRYLRVEALENGKSILTAPQREQLKTLVSSMRRSFHRRAPQAS
jgi:Spy/CpxP family protein refolding chaperone